MRSSYYNAGGEFFKATYGSNSKSAANNKKETARKTKGIRFKYEGQTAMTVRGPFSGKLYKFVHPGAILVTDPRDYRVLLTVPGLRAL